MSFEDEDFYTGPPGKKFKIYDKEWETHSDFKKWICASKKGEYFAYCKFCRIDFTVTAGRTLLIRHMSTKNHQRNSATSNDLMMNLEIRLAAFIAEHNNFSRELTEPLFQFIKAVAPDFQIAEDLAYSEQKMSRIITHVLGKEHKQNLINNMQQRYFSIIIDKSTDKAGKKYLCLLVRLSDIGFSTVRDEFFDLISVTNDDSESVFNSIVESMKKANIPYKENMIGFAADTASNMIGNDKSVVTMFLNEIPHLFVMSCICHSFKLCASYACKKLPRGLEDMTRGIYNYFSNSINSRCSGDFQDFVEFEPNKILHPCQERWLSLHQVVEQLIRKYDALQSFFKGAQATDRLLITEKLLRQLNEPTTKLYLHFLSFVLPIFDKLNKAMKPEELDMRNVLSDVKDTIKTILEFYLHPNYINSRELKDIDFKNRQYFLPMSKMYFGDYVATETNIQNILEDDLVQIRWKCLDFYIEAIEQITKRMPLDNTVIDLLNFLIPVKIKTISTIAPVAALFPNIIPTNQIESLDTEWRFMKTIENLDFNKPTLEFWKEIRAKFSEKQQMFPILSKFAFSLLSLPHSNANVERQFSLIEDIQSNKRLNLDDELLTGLLHSKQLLGENTSYDFPISKSMQKKYADIGNMYTL